MITREAAVTREAPARVPILVGVLLLARLPYPWIVAGLRTVAFFLGLALLGLALLGPILAPS